jgi:amino acid adenylation domain-containing protein
MKAGAAYVPLDPSAPLDRTAFVTRHCGIRHIVSASAKRRALYALTDADTSLDCLIGVSGEDRRPARCVGWDEVFSHPGNAPPDVKIIEQDLAYIIYTSGSTGTPKGIMHTHHSGLAFARWAAAEYGLRPDDCLSNHAPLHFDLSIFDFFAGAVAGAATSIIPEEYLKLPPSFSQLLQDQAITVLFTVPYALIQMGLHGVLEERDLSRLRWIIFGGEPFPVKHLHDLMQKLPHARFDNMYGPAEVNGCTHYTIDELDADAPSIPIGRISQVAEALVVDAQDRPVTPGEQGELLIRSPTMMQGYWRAPALNEKAFFENNEIEGYRQIYYRTGDIVEQRSDGNFMFLGRKDRQIKVRGYRIELDEIESALSSAKQVQEAAAYGIPDPDGNQQIYGEVTLKPGEAILSTELLAHIKSRLPWYAVPAELKIREQFPRTTTGKIDRRALREAALQAVS